jgi:hypothetical protein
MNRAVWRFTSRSRNLSSSVFAETLPSRSRLTVYQGETTSAHTCRALLSLPKQLHRLLCKPPATYTPDQIRRGSSETCSRRWL